MEATRMLLAVCGINLSLLIPLSLHTQTHETMRYLLYVACNNEVIGVYEDLDEAMIGKDEASKLVCDPEDVCILEWPVNTTILLSSSFDEGKWKQHESYWQFVG